MNCHESEPWLSEYVDGTLQASEQPVDVTRLDALEAHLAGCDRCRAVVEDLHTLRDAARTIGSRVPPAHVWTRISASLERPIASRFSRKALALAAMLVLVAGGSWLAWQQLSAPAATTSASQPGPRIEPDPALVQDVETQLKLAEEHYVKAIAGLEAIASAEGSALDQETTTVLQANLTVIDTAIGESRAALQTNPGSEVAQQSLFEALRTKVTLLQDTIALINEMRKGNQEGAARIASGLNQ